MAKARPMGSPARKAGGKEIKAPAESVAARKPLAARVAAGPGSHAAIVAPKSVKSAAARQTAVPAAPSVVPPPLPAPIASFTF